MMFVGGGYIIQLVNDINMAPKQKWQLKYTWKLDWRKLKHAWMHAFCMDCIVICRMVVEMFHWNYSSWPLNVDLMHFVICCMQSAETHFHETLQFADGTGVHIWRIGVKSSYLWKMLLPSFCTLHLEHSPSTWLQHSHRVWQCQLDKWELVSCNRSRNNVWQNGEWIHGKLAIDMVTALRSVTLNNDQCWPIRVVVYSLRTR